MGIVRSSRCGRNLLHMSVNLSGLLADCKEKQPLAIAVTKIELRIRMALFGSQKQRQKGVRSLFLGLTTIRR